MLFPPAGTSKLTSYSYFALVAPLLEAFKFLRIAKVVVAICLPSTSIPSTVKKAHVEAAFKFEAENERYPTFKIKARQDGDGTWKKTDSPRTGQLQSPQRSFLHPRSRSALPHLFFKTQAARNHQRPKESSPGDQATTLPHTH